VGIAAVTAQARFELQIHAHDLRAAQHKPPGTEYDTEPQPTPPVNHVPTLKCWLTHARTSDVSEHVSLSASSRPATRRSRANDFSTSNETAQHTTLHDPTITGLLRGIRMIVSFNCS
jgi:hypothetical protein